MLEKVLQGALAGVAYSLVGYGKKTKVPDFSWIRLGTTIVLGGVAGAIVEFTGQDMDVMFTMLVSGGFAGIVENGFKLVKRRFFTKSF